MARGGGGHSGGSGGFHGGHSSGGGSFGGRSSSHHTSSSYSGSSHSSHSSYSGHYGGSHYSGSHYSSVHNHTPHHTTYVYRDPILYGTRPHHYRGTGGSCIGCGCSNLLMWIIVLIVLITALRLCVGVMSCAAVGATSACVSESSSSGTALTTSTEKREKLDSKYVNYNNTWYTDELGWFGLRTSVTKNMTIVNGLESFYRKTGVQPYIYMVSYDAQFMGNGAGEANRYSYAESLYQQLFTDEGHFLWVYFACEDDSPDLMDGYYVYIVGDAARVVLDENAKQIFEDRLLYYYNDTSLDADEFLAQAFISSGKAIMSGPMYMRYVVIIVVSVLATAGIVVLLFIWWKKRKEQKNKEAEDLERILKTPLDTFGNNATDKLKDKYKDS